MKSSGCKTLFDIWLQSAQGEKEYRGHAISASDLLGLIDRVKERAAQAPETTTFTVSPGMEQKLKRMRHREYQWMARYHRMVRRRKIERRQIRAAIRQRKRGRGR